MTDAVTVEATTTSAAVAAPAAPAAVTPTATTPVAAPVETPAIADAPAEASYDPTGDAALDVSLAFLGKLGLGQDHPAIAAATMGNFTALEAILATMGDKAKGWEPMVQLGKEAYARASAAAEQTANAVKSAVHQVAGGEAQWQAVSKWAAENATPQEKAEINALFDSGIMGARSVAQLLTNMYNSATGTVVSPASAVRPGTSTAISNANAPLSPKEYGQAVRALSRDLGTRMEASPEYRALRQRLAAYRG